MEIVTAVESLIHEDLPNVMLVLVHTSEGRVGLGEGFYGIGAVHWVLHEQLAPALIGRPVPTTPSEIAEVFDASTVYVGQQGSGAEVRARSAIDLALWDLLARAQNRPLAASLGDPRPEIGVYNTCAGPFYIRRTGQRSSNRGLGSTKDYDDLNAFLTEPERLAEELLAEGITAMKIWPLDPAAEKTHGRSISRDDLRAGLEPFRRIRAAVGSEMGLLLELHALWEPGPARQILTEASDLDLIWAEDPIPVYRTQEMAELRAAVDVPIAAGETAGAGVVSERLVLDGAVDTLISDLTWCGGISGALPLGRLAAEHGIAWALHDCSGPVAFAGCVALALTHANVQHQEITRAYYRTWYDDLVTGLPEVSEGVVRASGEPGNGLCLAPDLRRHARATNTSLA